MKKIISLDEMMEKLGRSRVVEGFAQDNNRLIVSLVTVSIASTEPEAVIILNESLQFIKEITSDYHGYQMILMQDSQVGGGIKIRKEWFRREDALFTHYPTDGVPDIVGIEVECTDEIKARPLPGLQSVFDMVNGARPQFTKQDAKDLEELYHKVAPLVPNDIHFSKQSLLLLGEWDKKKNLMCKVNSKTLILVDKSSNQWYDRIVGFYNGGWIR